MAMVRVVQAFLISLLSVCAVLCDIKNCVVSLDKQLIVPECETKDAPFEKCGDAIDHCTCGMVDKRIVTVCDSDKSHYIPAFPFEIDTLCIKAVINKIKTGDFFANVSSISALKMHVAVYGDTFSIAALTPLKNLTRFSLSLNGDIEIDDDEIAYILRAVPTLRELGLPSCYLTAYYEKIWSPHHLDVLDMSFNHISTLYLQGQSSLTVRRADFRHNYLDTVMAFGVLPRLEELILSSNSLTYFPDTCSDSGESYFPNLRLLDLSSNKIRFTPRPDDGVDGPCVPKLEVLILDNNDLIDGEFAYLWGGVYPSLVVASFGSFHHFDVLLKDMPALECVFYNKNDYVSIEQIIHTFDNCSSLRYLDLSENIILMAEQFQNHSNLKPMQSFRNVESLILHTCDLGGRSDRRALSTLMNILPNLVLLDISNNNLRYIPNGLFDGLLNLRNLSVSSNFLTVVSPDMFSAVTRDRLQKLDFSGNPFACSCDILWFKSWIASSPSKFVKTEEYWCVTGDRVPDIPLLDYKLSEQACLLSHEAYVAITYIILFTLVFAVITVSVWRYKWHLRLLLYDMFRGPGDARRLRLQHGHFDYDVFVSYDSDDQLWVFGKLVPELEGRLGLKLCLHERDFIPGTQIIDNIAKRVEASKKILMVWSRHFVDSKWCQFELTFCLQHAMDTEDALVIVCLDDVTSSKDITPAMMAVLKTTTYIQWVGERRGQAALDSFWGRLRVALKEVIPEAEHQV